MMLKCTREQNYDYKFANSTNAPLFLKNMSNRAEGRSENPAWDN